MWVSIPISPNCVLFINEVPDVMVSGLVTLAGQSCGFFLRRLTYWLVFLAASPVCLLLDCSRLVEYRDQIT